MEIQSSVLVVLVFCASGLAEQCKSTASPPQPQGGCCGYSNNDKIIPGFIARLDDYPWIGLVEYQKGNKTVPLCGAVLISGRYALSAAVCFKHVPNFKPVKVRFGQHDISNEGRDCVDVGGVLDCNDGPVSIAIEDTITHPGYKDDGSRRHDIALIRLAETVPLSDFVSPICLPTSDVTVDPPKRFHLRFAGWGPINSTTIPTDLLHQIYLPYVNLDACKSAYAPFKIPVESDQLCAGSERTAACGNDIGAPLMHFNNGYNEVAGIFSFGPTPCGKSGIPGLFTKVFAYNAWIRENIKE